LSWVLPRAGPADVRLIQEKKKSKKSFMKEERDRPSFLFVLLDFSAVRDGFTAGQNLLPIEGSKGNSSEKHQKKTRPSKKRECSVGSNKNEVKGVRNNPIGGQRIYNSELSITPRGGAAWSR